MNFTNKQYCDPFAATKRAVSALQMPDLSLYKGEATRRTQEHIKQINQLMTNLEEAKLRAETAAYSLNQRQGSEPDWISPAASDPQINHPLLEDK
jgi:hypothetical protein